MSATTGLRAWRPPVDGIVEVFHARLTDHVYPMHTHDAWTLLIVDDGKVTYDLDRHAHGAVRTEVTLLPPHVPHNGTPDTAEGLRKRVLYLDPAQLDERLIGPAVDRPALRDPALRRHVHGLHRALTPPGEKLEAESRLALVTERLRRHLERRARPIAPADGTGLAHRLRDLLDARLTEGLTLREASGALHAHPAHLVRAFGAEFGIAPHQYLISRRVDLARRLLLDGVPPRSAATASGFYDQAHLTRHFTRVLGVGPGRYARAKPG